MYKKLFDTVLIVMASQNVNHVMICSAFEEFCSLTVYIL